MNIEGGTEMLRGLDVGASVGGSQRPREDRCSAQRACEQDLSSTLLIPVTGPSVMVMTACGIFWGRFSLHGLDSGEKREMARCKCRYLISSLLLGSEDEGGLG